jgi:hypothetical protein
MYLVSLTDVLSKCMPNMRLRCVAAAGVTRFFLPQRSLKALAAVFKALVLLL